MMTAIYHAAAETYAKVVGTEFEEALAGVKELTP
jgi:hypothetical protein